MKWRMKILLMCLACTLSALVLQTVLFQNTSSGILTGRVKAETVGSLQNLQNSVYSYLNNMESNLIKIYEEDEFVDALNKGADISALKGEFLSLAQDFTLSAFETTDGVRAVYLYNAQHEIISTYRRAVTPKHNYPTDIYSDPQYNGETIRQYIESSDTGMVISSYYNTHREKDILHLVMKIFAGYQYDRAVGYIVCDVDSDTITALMKKCIADQTLFVWLQPAGDRVAVSIGELREDQQSDFQQISGENAGEGVSARELEDMADTELFQVAQTRYDLTAYSLMSQELLRQNQQALSMNLATIAALMILVAVVLTSFVVRSMTRPLDKLTRTIDRIKAGQTQLRVEVDRNDELGVLSRNVNEMLDNLEDFRMKEQEHIRLLDQAEYRALQAQINPHFLYNTLETMAGIAEMEECPQVSQLSYSLSRIFRYSLNTKEGLSTVKKEIEHLKNYTYIMSERMHDNVQYVYDIDPGVEFAPIPRLSLQPLVENALNHGLKNRAGQKQVRISAKLLEEELLVSVEDNGVGMDAEAMNRSMSQDDLHRATTGTSIGLHNINARLKLLYGEQYGLRIESHPGRGTRVIMTIPQKKAVNADE